MAISPMKGLVDRQPHLEAFDRERDVVVEGVVELVVGDVELFARDLHDLLGHLLDLFDVVVEPFDLAGVDALVQDGKDPCCPDRRR